MTIIITQSDFHMQFQMSSNLAVNMILYCQITSRETISTLNFAMTSVNHQAANV